MKTFIVEIYELHATRVVVQAENKQEAAVKALQGEADMLDDSTEYIEVADEYHGVDDDTQEAFPAGIRSVEEEEE